MKDHKIHIAVVGGDLRQLALLQKLSYEGFSISRYGFDTYRPDVSKYDTTVKESESLSEALLDTDVLALPLPMMQGGNISTPFSAKKISCQTLLSHLPSGIQLISGGKIPEDLRNEFAGRHYRVLEYTENERFNRLNAIPTAEGAIAVAMNHLTRTLFGRSVAVIGFGRIGRVLSRRLIDMGCHVTVTARKTADLADAEIMGCRAFDYDSPTDWLCPIELVFNTVPEVIITDTMLSRLPKDAVIIDLASSPGGIDKYAAERQNRKIISALSLPGKVAPTSAGEIMADCLLRSIREVLI